MKKLAALGLVVALMTAVVTLPGSAKDKEEKAVKNPRLGSVRHVVLFKFKEGTPTEKVKEIEEAFRALPTKIPTIEDFEWGTNISPENASQGLTHCFFLTFKDAAARDAYLPHPAHKEFGALLRPHKEKVVVIDYVAQP